MDDVAHVCAALRRLLRRDGHAVTCASSGSDGLKLLQESRFDLLVVDRSMPGLDGDEVAVLAKAIQGIPVLMTTGHGAEMRAAGEVPEGVDRVLAKPVDFDDLRQAIAGLCVPRVINGAEGPQTAFTAGSLTMKVVP